MRFISLFERHPAGPRTERVRHEAKVRMARVVHVERVTPGMLRICFTGPELADFVSRAPDDHVKLLLPTDAGETVRRDYTPRRFDPQAKLLTIDFAVHDAGPATNWALRARPGDTLQIAGPKSSTLMASPVARWLLIGDETALPAIGRRIEEAGPGTQITSLVAVTGPAERQAFTTAADLTALWAYRPLASASDPRPLLSMAEAIDVAPETFAWVAAEAHVARAVRAWLIDDRRHPRSWLKAGGYWVVDKANAHERLDD